MSINRTRSVLSALGSMILATLLFLAISPVLSSNAYAEEQLDAPSTGIQITADTPATRWNVEFSEDGQTKQGWIAYEPASMGKATLTLSDAVYDTGSTTAVSIDLPGVSVDVVLDGASALTGSSALSIQATELNIKGTGSLELRATGADPALTIPAGMKTELQEGATLTLGAGSTLSIAGSLYVMPDATFSGGSHCTVETTGASILFVRTGAAFDMATDSQLIIEEGTLATFADSATPTKNSTWKLGDLQNRGTLRFYRALYPNQYDCILEVEGDFVNGSSTSSSSTDGVVENQGYLKLNGTTTNYGTIENERWIDLNGDTRNYGLITVPYDTVVLLEGGTYEGEPVQATVPDPCDGIVLTSDHFAPMRFITTNSDGTTGSVLATQATDGDPLTVELENASIHSAGRYALAIHIGDDPARIILKGDSVLDCSSGFSKGTALELGSKNTTIEGDGTLTLQGSYGIGRSSSSSDPSVVTFAGGTVNANGYCGIVADKVVFSGGTVVANGTGEEDLDLPAAGLMARSMVGDGNAFVVLNSAYASGGHDDPVDLSRDGFTSGVLIVGDEGRVHGDDVTLAADAEVPAGSTLEVPAGTTLTIPAGVTLTVSANAKLVNAGKIDLKGTLKVAGTLVNEGAIHVFTGAVLDTDAGTLEDPGEIIYDEEPPSGGEDDGTDDGAGDDDAEGNDPSLDHEDDGNDGAANDSASTEGDEDGTLLSLMGDNMALGFVALGAAALSLAFFALFHARRRPLGKHARR